MTSIYITKRDSAVHIATDGAGLDGQTGAVMGYLPKVLVMPHLNLALATRGEAGALALAAQLIGQCGTTFDQVRAHIGAKLSSAVAAEKANNLRIATLLESGAAYEPRHSQILEATQNLAPLANPLQLFIVGISESRGPEAYVVGTTDANGLVPFEVVPIDDSTATPLADMDVLTQAQTMPPDEAATHVFEAMRRTSDVLPGTTTRRYLCGGPVSLTTVSRGEIRTVSLGVFWDRIGVPIDPRAAAFDYNFADAA